MVTIKDVAEAAGVSIGTVDRVLHGRPGVSEKSRKKVLKVIDEIGFVPNVNASVLASGSKDRLIVCLMPEVKKGEIWDLWNSGLDASVDYAHRYSVSIEKIFYDQNDSASFEEACDRVLNMNPSAVILAPMFRMATLRFVKMIKDAGIPYVYIDNKMDDDGYYAYFGMPMYHSGYLAGYLITTRRESDIREIVNVRIARDKESLSDPTLMRRLGFMDYINEHLPNCRVRDVIIDPRSEDNTDRILDEAISNNGSEQYLVMFNSRVHLLARYLHARDIRNCYVLGYDMLPKNIEYLNKGVVSSLITQHCDEQMRKAVVSLTDHLVMGKNIGRKDNFTQMDILIKHNCEFYV